jgi:hypothetical protein
LLLSVVLRVFFTVVLCTASIAQAQDAGALRARHAALRAQLADNAFGRPLHIESTAAAGTHKGEIYVVVDQPYRTVAAALARPASWCEILTLQVNIKRCSADGESLTAFITRKPRDAADGAHRVDFRYEPVTAGSDYFRAALGADSGPIGTRAYRILLEATPLDARRTFLHMSYAYRLGWGARLAMDAYLAGAGRDKPGFSVIGGERGVAERGAMRHYLAIEAYLESRALETRLRQWYAATARYPQLRESISADEYVEMKLREAVS